MSDQPNGVTAPPPEGHREPKVIKRYANRKLYDTGESRYVTLDEIARMIKDGAEVRVVDNRTKDDLTAVTLAQIIFEEEKKKSRMPLSMLKEIVRHGGDALSGFYQEKVATKVAGLREELSPRLGRLFKRGDGEARAAVKEGLAQSQRAIEEWQKRIAAPVKQVVGSVSSLTHLQGELQRMREKIEELERKVDELQ